MNWFPKRRNRPREHRTPKQQPPRGAAVYWDTSDTACGDVHVPPELCAYCQTVDTRDAAGNLIRTDPIPCPTHLANCLDGTRTPDQIDIDALHGIAAHIAAEEAAEYVHRWEKNR